MRKSAFLFSLLVIFIIPWEGIVRIPGLGTGTSLLGFGLIFLWVATVVINGQLRKLQPFHIALSLFVVWNVFSVYWSADPSRTLEKAWTWAQLLIFTIVLWDLYTSREDLMAGLQAFVLGTYVAISSALINYFANNAFYTNYQRFSPEDTHPDGFGFIVALAIPIAWYLASSKSTTKWGNLLKFLNYAFIPVGFLGIVLSGTRTALIASIVGNAFGLASLSRVRLSIRLACLLLLMMVVFFMLPRVEALKSFQRFSTVGTELTHGSLNDRTNLWRDGLDSFMEHPLLGIGSDMYRSVNSMGKVAHNSFISVLVEVGLVGFVIFGIILMIAFFTAWKLPRWDSFFWLTVLMVWTIGASTLTWEFRKTTWLFLSLIIANSALIAHPGEEHSFLQDRAPFASLSSFRRQNTSQTNDAEMKSTE